MAGFNYTKSQERAAKLLERFGGASELTITYASSTSYDVDRQVNTKVPSIFTGWGVVSPYADRLIDGESILSTDLELFLEKTSQRPVVGDTVNYDSKDFSIINVEVVAPGGVDVMYICQLRLG